LNYQYLILFYKIKTKDRLRFSVKAQNLVLEGVGKAEFQLFSSPFPFNRNFTRYESKVFPSLSKHLRSISSF